ncbi:MAG: TRAP transporter TatT component family protein [Myxococcota bacterium]
MASKQLTGTRVALAALTATAALTASGCNLTSMAAGQTIAIIEAGKPSVDAQPDLRVARVSIESNIGMMEGLRITRPDDKRLHKLMGEAYTGYAFGFVEDDLDASEDEAEREVIADRAAALYLRGRTAALEALSLSRKIPNLVDASDADFDAALAKLEKGDVGSLFWAANAWGNLVNLRQDPVLLMEMPRVEAMMNRVLALDESYYDGGGHLFFALLKLSVPAALSDETEAAARHFDEALRIADGKNMLIVAMRARFLLVATRDREGFREALESVLEADPELSREHNLLNSLARVRARRWLGQIDRFFPTGG